MDPKLTYKGAVMTWECDSNGHMNVMYYINKYENAGRNFDLDLGLTTLLSEEKETVGMVVVEQKIQYLKEAFEDDLLYVMSELNAVGNKSITMTHKMYNGHTKEHIGTMNLVCVLFDKVNRVGLVLTPELKEELNKKINH